MDAYDLDKNAFSIADYLGKVTVLAASEDIEMHTWLNAMLKQQLIIEEQINQITINWSLTLYL